MRSVAHWAVLGECCKYRLRVRIVSRGVKEKPLQGAKVLPVVGEGIVDLCGEKGSAGAEGDK